MICPLQQECVAFPVIQSTLQTLPKGTRLKNEGKFEGSNRWYRGRAIEALRGAETGLPLSTLGARLRENYSDDDLPWLVDLVRGLERDGLASVAEERAEYSVDTDAAEMIVRLPH